MATKKHKLKFFVEVQTQDCPSVVSEMPSMQRATKLVGKNIQTIIKHGRFANEIGGSVINVWVEHIVIHGAGPLFKLGDKVRSKIHSGTSFDGKVGTIVRAPEKRSKRGSILFSGQYAYDVDFDGRIQRMAEDHIAPLAAAAGR